jgi:hypothetical protein
VNVVGEKPPPKKLSIIDIARVHPDGVERSIFRDGALIGPILTTDLGFTVTFLNEHRKTFSGFLAVDPPDNIGVLATSGPAAAAATVDPTPSVASGSPGSPSAAQAPEKRNPPPGVPFAVAPGQTKVLFPFSADSLNFPSGRFLMSVFAGAPQVSPVILSAAPDLSTNVRFNMELVPQTVPDTSFKADIVVEARNNYSENARVRVTAVARGDSGGLAKGTTLAGFKGIVVIEEEFLENDQNAYTPSADIPPRGTVPKGQKGFFTVDGVPLEETGLLFTSSGGSGGPGTQDFVAKSLREATRTERDLKRLDEPTAIVVARLKGESTPRGRVEIPQWVDFIGRSRAADGRVRRTEGGDEVRDWLQEHGWDIITRTRPGSIDAREAERADIFDTVKAVVELTSLAQPEPGSTVAGSQEIGLNSFSAPMRTGRPAKIKDQIAGELSVPFDTSNAFSNVVHHEARHAWQNFLVKIDNADLVGALLPPSLDDNDRGTAALRASDLRESGSLADADNDDDPRPFELRLPNSKPDDGDWLPERAFKRAFAAGEFTLTLDEYPDAVTDRSPFQEGATGDARWQEFGDILGTLVGEEFIPDDPHSFKERDAFDYGNQFQREE